MQKIIWLVIFVLLIILFFKPKEALPSAPEEPLPPKEEVKEKPSIKVYAKEKVEEKWGVGQWEAFNTIIKRESANWTVLKEHYPETKKSSAYGLGGFLNSTWKDVGCVKTSDPYIQIDCTMKYISQRYGTPSKAKTFHDKNNWY